MRLDLRGHALREGIAIDNVPLGDLFPDVTRTGPAYWEENDVLVIPLSRELTTAEAIRLTIRLCSPTSVVEQRMVQAAQAVNDIDAYLSLASPGTQAVIGEVRLLSQVVRELLFEYLKDTTSAR